MRAPRAHHWGRVAFERLLVVYPRWFRDAHGEEMSELFLARLARARTARAGAVLWGRTIADALQNGLALRRADGSRREVSMDMLRQDIRHAVRRLVRSPTFTLGAIALLAVGIGANTTVFTVVDALLFRAPPWSEPERVLRIYQDTDEGAPGNSSFPAYRDMTEFDVFTAVAATSTPFVPATWDSPDGLTPVAIEYTTSGYMQVLGLDVQRGRWFAPEDDVVGATPSAVVSDATWRSRFGGDPGVIGRTIQLNGYAVTIVGVGPERLTGTSTPLRTDFWVSIAGTVIGGSFQVANLERREDHWYQVLARLAPGVGLSQAQAAMDALARRHAELYPELDTGRDITVFAARDVRMAPGRDEDVALAGGLLAVIALAVLLLACANLANVLLVRGLDRSGEIAVRSALGAPRGRVARLFLIESSILAAVGGGVGLLLTWWALDALPSLPLAAFLGGALELELDARVAGFALGLMALTGLLFGLAPAVRSARSDVGRALREERRGSSAGRGTLRLRDGLVVVQVAASLVLVLATGLVARSLTALQTTDTGVDVDRVAYLTLDWTRAGIAPEASFAALEEMQGRIESLPGVERAAVTSRLPAMQQGSTTTEVEDYVPGAGTNAVEMPFAIVDDAYLETMGIAVLAGRGFGPDDVPPEISILINETAARRYWGSPEAALGRHMRAQGAATWTRTVVGVVEDVPVNALGEPALPLMYFTTRQRPVTPSYVVARTDGDPEALLAPMRREIAAWQPAVTVNGQGTVVSHLGSSLAMPRFAATAMGAFSLLALILAGLGVYTVVSYAVARRSAELGIRIALGADRSGVVWMVVGEVARVVVVGSIVGVVLAAIAAPRFGGMLYGVDALDPAAFITAVVLLLAVAWAAAYVPARRAARADPVQALRA
ncbi:MAG: ADOP family duplicated permease [Gemmatimonadales bacterium]